MRSSENVSDLIEPRKIGIQQLSAARSSEAQDSPPKPPRSAFMCFTDAKKTEIMSQHGVQKKDVILKMVANEWKSLSASARTHWEEEARNDKIRFVRQKAAYKGPWAIPKRRAKKHPLAPKRPMSAFLKYSQTRRTKVKEENPDMSNTDVSRLLGEMWRNAPPRERAPYVEQEERERAIYKENIRRWRENQARMDAASRTNHHSMQNYHYHHVQSKEQPYRPAIFESMQFDAFEEQGRKGSYTHQYEKQYPYHRAVTSSNVSLQRESEIGEDDPIPLSRSTNMEDDDSISVHYGGTTQSSFFSDNMNLGYYSRYP